MISNIGNKPQAHFTFPIEELRTKDRKSIVRATEERYIIILDEGSIKEAVENGRCIKEAVKNGSGLKETVENGRCIGEAVENGRCLRERKMYKGKEDV